MVVANDSLQDVVGDESRQIALLAALERELALRKAENWLAGYRPYRKQMEFHSMARRERLLMAANQVGKTVAGAAEMAMHLTGLYPDWWIGRRFDRPIVAWAGSVTGPGTRDTVQRLLAGRPGQIGTGAVPKRCIADKKSAMGVPDLLDHIKVTHSSGGTSMLSFKSYEQGREKWQGESLDLVWFDEEPPEDVYYEGLTRTNATGGAVFVTFTPLLGMSSVVSRFLLDKAPGTGVVTMTIDDAEHYSAEQRAAIIASYPRHEREARAKGVPSLGSGRIFPVEEELIAVPAFPIPAYWPRIVGLDFGWDHPTAAVWLAWDRDADVLYVTDCYRRSEATVIQHASVIRSKGSWIPVAWPHDGMNDTAVGPQLAKQYKAEGIAMRPENAKFPEQPDGGPKSRTSVEAGLAEMLTRMETGRFKVFSHLNDWFEEFRLYHRKDGRIVKEKDDLMSATRYGLMDLRYAKTKDARRTGLVEPETFDTGVGW